ncbi:MAG: murein L,D-transpeptidase [Dichotomicrobium sp.]
MDKRVSKKRLRTTVMASAMFVALCAPMSASDDAVALEDWMQFGDKPGSSWSQPFDRSFVRRWESQPRRGYATLSKENIEPTRDAIRRYSEIVSNGGWKRIPDVKLRAGVSDRAVAVLRQRLRISGDLEQRGGYTQTFDYYVEKAVKRAQKRHGLSPTGVVDRATRAALNVSAQVRLRQLRQNLNRLANLSRKTERDDRYVLVNIPAAQIEAVENGQVVSRHSAVVGKPSRQTPILDSRIHELNFNKEWILPPTVIRKDLVPKGRSMSQSGKSVLKRYGIDAYASYDAYRRGDKMNPSSINWSSSQPLNLFYAQEAGNDNPLGFVKLNFHNKHAVYLHDTPSQSLFGRNRRAESSGCVRVQGVQQLVSWVLRDTPGWSLSRVRQIKRSGERQDVDVTNPVPLYMDYITAWATPDGVVHFRRDIYGRDGVGATASAY